MEGTQFAFPPFCPNIKNKIKQSQTICQVFEMLSGNLSIDWIN